MQKTVLITGSTSGIGLGIAKKFALAGYSILLHGLEPADELAQVFRSEYGVKVVHSNENLATPDGVRRLGQFALDQLGPISVLVNNAGVQQVAPIETFPLEKWNLILALHLTAPFLLSQILWPAMKSQGFGRIIQIASVHGLVASEFKSAYVAAKHGVIGLTKTLALEGAPHGITVNAICPGYVRTPLVENQIRDQAQVHKISEAEVISKILLAKHSLKEFVEIDEIASLCLFLSSPESKTLTGAALPIDGGWTAQ